MQFAVLKETELANHIDAVKRHYLMPARDDGRVSPNSARIKRLRKHYGYSQEYVAGMTGINIKTIENLESKINRRCKLATLKSLAVFFDVEIRTLINHERRLPDTRVLKVHRQSRFLMGPPLEIEQDFPCSGLINPREYVVSNRLITGEINA